MNQFTFEAKQKSVLGALMILGVVCMVITYFTDDIYHTRFWTNLLHNTVFFTGISFISLFVLAAFTTAYAGWHTVLKRVWEAYSLFLPVGLLFLIILIAGVWGHWHHLYHWAADGLTDPTNPNYDAILAGKSGFLNKGWYTFGTLIIVGTWTFFAFRLRALSLQEDAEGGQSLAIHKRVKWFSAAFLPIAAFTSCAMVWQWIMSIDAHWYSTMFAWYTTASWFVSAMAITILMLIYLKSKGYYENITAEHFHDVGKYLFGFSVFWTYLWFSQYMLIWYANVGEETGYFLHRVENYQIIWYGNLILNFVLPFLILMRNDTKRKFGSLAFVSVLVLFGHWIDFFMMIKPGALITAKEAMAHGATHGAEAVHSASDHGAPAVEHIAGHADTAMEFMMGFTIPGLLEIGTFLGFGALFVYLAFSRLSQAALTPEHDPYLGESLHHHV